MQKIYLDNAATTPIDKDVISVIIETMESTYGNPSSTHQFGRSARAMIEQSRKKIARILNCSATEIVFTAGGSEADNLILFNAVKNLGINRIITSKIEHHAILHTIKVLQDDYHIKVNFVDLNAFGEVDLDHLNSLLQDTSYQTLVS